MRDQRTVERVRAIRGTHRVRVCKAVCSDGECIASSGTHGTQGRLRNRGTKVDRQLVAEWIQCNLFLDEKKTIISESIDLDVAEALYLSGNWTRLPFAGCCPRDIHNFVSTMGIHDCVRDMRAFCTNSSICWTQCPMFWSPLRCIRHVAISRHVYSWMQYRRNIFWAERERQRNLDCKFIWISFIGSRTFYGNQVEIQLFSIICCSDSCFII